MPTFQSLVAFFGVAVLLALSPGPDNLFVLMQSVQRGWRVGIAVVVGLCLGVVVHTMAVALGLALQGFLGLFPVTPAKAGVYISWLIDAALGKAAALSRPLPSQG